MAEVPTLAVPDVQIRPAPTNYYQPNIRLLNQAFGQESARSLTNVAGDIGNVADEANRIALQQHAEDVERQAKQADADYATKLRTLQFGDGTAANPGLYGLRGQHAINAIPDANAQAQKFYDQTLSSISDPHVKDLFSAAGQARQNSALEAMDRFGTEQRLQANNDASTARIANAVADAATFWNDPVHLQTQLGIIHGEVLSMKDQNGYDDATAQSLLTQHTDAALGGAFNAAVAAGGYNAGKAFFGATSGLMSGDERTKAENNLLVAQRAQQADIEHQAVMGRLAADQASENSLNQYLVGLEKTGTLPIQQIANDQSIRAAQRLTLISLQKSIDSGEALSKTSASTMSQILPALYLSPGDPNRIYSRSQLIPLVASKQLSVDDFGKMGKMIDDAATPEGNKIGTRLTQMFAGIRGSITKSDMLGNITDGGEQYYAYQSWVQSQVDAARAANQNPWELITPNYAPGSKYLGTPARLEMFKLPMDQLIRNLTAEATGGEKMKPNIPAITVPNSGGAAPVVPSLGSGDAGPVVPASPGITPAGNNPAWDAKYKTGADFQAALKKGDIPWNDESKAYAKERGWIQ